MRNLASIVVLVASLIALSVGYSTSGNRILDPSGNPILLRGVARPSLEWDKNGERLSLADYRIMKDDWKCNVVRLGLSQCFWLPGKEYDSTYIARVHQQVTDIKSLGMGVILDLHRSDKGNGNDYCGQQVMADSRSVTFWKEVAAKYANDPWVIFELYNEPHDVPIASWKSGGPTGGGWDTPGHQALYDAVRNTGAKNVVIINGLDWAYDLSHLSNSNNLINGYNIVYGTHPYDFDGKRSGDWDADFGFLSNSYPLIATEFGSFDCSTSYVSQFISYANTKAISWTAWGWYPQGCGFPSIIAGWDGAPSAMGGPVRKSLREDSKIPSGGTSTTKSATTSASTSTTKAATTTTSTTKAATTTTTTSGSSTTGGSSGAVTEVYTDSLQNSFVDYSWNQKIADIAVSSPVQSGSKSIKFTPSGWNAIYFFRSQFIDTSVHKYVEFYIHGGTSGGQLINFNMIRQNGDQGVKTGPDSKVTVYLIGSDKIKANEWVRGSVNLDSFPSGKYDGFWFQDQNNNVAQAPVYIDSVRLIGR